MSTVYRERERERERDFDDVASVRSARSGTPRHVTTIRRYKYPSDDERDGEYHTEDTKVVIREKERETEPRDRVEYRVIERDRERESDTISRRGTDRDVRSSYRVIERQEDSRSASPENRDREIRIIRERERSPEAADDRLGVPRSPYQLEKYSKSTEFFSRPDPQTIIIRQETPQPIIIRETIQPQQLIVRERSEPSYDVIDRNEVVEDRQVVPRRQEEDYYYERRTREVDRPRRRDRDYDDEDEREYRRHRHDDRDYYSDDDVVYIRRERDADAYYGRERSPHHKLHLLEGVAAGVAAAEIKRHRRKSRGENPGSHVGQLVGYGALGGIGAEALTRWRNRSRSQDRDGRGRRRSRSRSISKGQVLVGAAALAGLGALAYVAGKNNSKNNTTVINEAPVRGRSVSRGRGYSASDVSEEYVDEQRERSESRHLDPQHRKNRVAQAGLVGAALAGLAEHARSKSRGGRSKSRVKQAVPIVAAGLGSAAVAGLYERHQAKKEERRERSRSVGSTGNRNKSVSESERGRTVSDTALVEYGGDPIYSASARERQRPSRSRSVGRYADENISPDARPRHHRSRSRSRGLAEAAAVAGAAGLAAHELTKRRERRRARERELERQRQEEQVHDPYPPIENQPTYYPATNAFPPPPTDNQFNQPSIPPQGGFAPPPQQPVFTEPVHTNNYNYNQPAYGAPGAPNVPQQDPYAREQAPPPPPAGGFNEFDAQGRPLRPGGPVGPEHVSASGPGTSKDGRPPGSVQPSRGAVLTTSTDGVVSAEATPRAASPVVAAAAMGAGVTAVTEEGLRARDGRAEGDQHVRERPAELEQPVREDPVELDQPMRERPAEMDQPVREWPAESHPQPEPEPEPEHHVMFDLHPHVAQERQRQREREREQHHSHGHDHGHDGAHDRTRERERDYRRDPSPTSSTDSGDTIEEPELSDRFDEHGNRRDDNDDPLARKIKEIIAGNGSGGLGGLLDNLFGGGHAHSRRGD